MNPTAHVPAPDVTFEDETPVSTAFDDVYFSRDGGIEETQYVFLKGNNLPARFASSLTIAELGFGTGLNFLVAWQSFLEHAPAKAHLHFVSVEKFPLTQDMLAKALALQPDLKPLADQLIAHYPLRLPGFHRIHFPRVTLTLGFGDATDLLPQLPNASIDAWFLDGFAPAKNPDMWSDTLFTAIGTASRPDATFATFTAAGFVRRGLIAQGFTVDKIPGYGHKREMLVGRKAASTDPDMHPRTASHGKPQSGGGLGVIPPSGAQALNNSALVLGAGIAGATTAHALAERGFTVTVLERHSIADGASGNPAAVLFPQLTKRWTASAAWYFTAYSFMLHQLQRWQAPHTRCGMLRLPRHADEETQLRTLGETLGLDPTIVHWIEKDTAAAIAGLPLATGAAYFPQGTWLEPAKLCTQLLQHPNITLHTETDVTMLERHGDQWRAVTADGTSYEAPHCILACAGYTATLAPQHGLKLGQVAGQVSLMPASATAAPLRSILCYKGYVIPAGDHYLMGATYNHHDFSRTVTKEGHDLNLADTESFLRGWLQGEATDGRTSIRTTTPDRLPYIGALEDGLWVSTGHGSRGMLSAPLGAEILASAILGEPAPLAASLLQSVNPKRVRPA